MWDVLSLVISLSLRVKFKHESKHLIPTMRLLHIMAHLGVHNNRLSGLHDRVLRQNVLRIGDEGMKAQKWGFLAWRTSERHRSQSNWYKPACWGIFSIFVCTNETVVVSFSNWIYGWLTKLFLHHLDRDNSNSLASSYWKSRRSCGSRLTRGEIVCCFFHRFLKNGKSYLAPFSEINASFNSIPFAKFFYILYEELKGVDCRPITGY